MGRSFRYGVGCLAAAAVLTMASAAHAQAKPSAAQASQPRYRMIHSQMPSLPGYYMLRMEHVQKELDLVPEQLKKLEELGKQYYADMRADQGAWKNWREMTPEKRTARSAELQEKYKKRAASLRDSIERVLLPHQIKLMKEINFRATGPSALANPRTLDKLQVTDQQKDELQKIRQEMLEKYQELQKKTFEKSLDVLTEKQRENLKEQIQTRGY